VRAALRAVCSRSRPHPESRPQAATANTGPRSPTPTGLRSRPCRRSTRRRRRAQRHAFPATSNADTHTTDPEEPWDRPGAPSRHRDDRARHEFSRTRSATPPCDSRTMPTAGRVQHPERAPRRVPVATPMSRAPQWPRIGSRKDPLRGMIGEGCVAKTRQLLRFLGTSASLPPLRGGIDGSCCLLALAARGQACSLAGGHATSVPGTVASSSGSDSTTPAARVAGAGGNPTHGEPAAQCGKRGELERDDAQGRDPLDDPCFSGLDPTTAARAAGTAGKPVGTTSKSRLPHNPSQEERRSAGLRASTTPTIR